jgi:RNase adaptor protein for sRNA GlmZ degradation
LDNVELPLTLPALMAAFRAMLNSEKLQAVVPEKESIVATQTLTVRIFSFSFHRSVPKDETGNGGGFIFDARSLPNPGREERFKPFTGKDAPVIDYLSRDSSVHQFLSSAISLVDSTLNNYQSRGFKNLMVSFGCTGGQHRSVYLAEELAKHLRSRHSINVFVHHLELEKQAK